MNEGWRRLTEAITALQQMVESGRAQLVLVCVPAAAQVDSTYWWAKRLGVRLDGRVLHDTEFQNRLAEFAKSERIPLIDLLPVMRAHPERIVDHHRAPGT